MLPFSILPPNCCDNSVARASSRPRCASLPGATVPGRERADDSPLEDGTGNPHAGASHALSARLHLERIRKKKR